ncbi:MAG: putative Ig domain-containing protein [Terriglobales bacterium]
MLALIGCSCATSAKAAGSHTDNRLAVSASLPDGTINQPYNAVFSVGGGASPYLFSVSSGSLPPGLTLNQNTGSLSGAPSATGSYTFQLLVTDAGAEQGNAVFTVDVKRSVQSGFAITVSPTVATVNSGGRQQFTATVTGTSNTAVLWSAAFGSIDKNGLYTAPAVQSGFGDTVTATSKVNSAQNAQAAVTVSPSQGQTLQITTSSLPAGQSGNTYSDVLSATGGTSPYSWSISSGSLPSGVTLNESGDLSGAPSATGTFPFSVTVTDASQNTATASLSMSVTQGSGYDGPAKLPLVTIPSSMADTPAPGSIIHVNAGDDLQLALNQAECGQTLELQAGATFSGQFFVPAKNCNATHWIVIRTSAPDTSLPPEGQRLTPCYAGVASLPGRPAYSCSNPQSVVATIQMTKMGNGPIVFANRANYYRLIGLELTRPYGVSGNASLISFEGTADHIFVDRSWLHGQAQDETSVGFASSGGTNIAVLDSYWNDFHCIARTGICTDAHAIAGGVGNNQDGPYLIQDNFLEASGEEVMFGGGPANKTPTDITIQGNHFFKPWQWMPGNPNFVGSTDGNPFIVKNHLELKNAVRVLIQANLFEDNWGGFTQHGYSILLTPKNQRTTSGQNVCPLCQVTDVTIRYDQISHAGGGIEIASAKPQGGVQALAGTRFSLHDLVLDDLSTSYDGEGVAFEIFNGWQQNPINTITINHVTAFSDATSHLMVTSNDERNPPMFGLVFTNNLVLTAAHPIWNAFGESAGRTCAEKDVPMTTISKCFTTYNFQNNGLIASPSAFPPSSWPKDNMFPSSPAAVQFVNFNGGNGGNYELLPSSPYKNKGTDGKDLGADVAGLMQQLANVP